MAITLLVLMALPVLSISASEAAAQEKSLKLYFVHTGEKAVITFKRNGKFDPKGLAQINQLLRDWRRNEPARMDPRLFDLVWEVYRRSGASDYIHVVSAYRSPTTNNMLRTRSRNTGVAKNSQHMLGKAMDFYIPGVKLSTLRGLAMQMQVGGVGYYPTSGSPFVHLDVGGVRAWPRMTRQELVQIFPKGNTIHLPADGKPLPGYETAMADYKRRVGSDSIQIASTAGAGIRGDSERKRQPNLLAFLFGGGGADEEEDNEESAAPVVARRAAPAAKPAADDEGEAPVAVASASPLTGQMQNQNQAQAPAQAQMVAAPVPLSRPAFRSDAGGLATALYSPARNPAQEALALQASAPVQPSSETFADLSTYNIPVPTLLGPRGFKGDAESGVMTASVGPMQPPEDVASVPLPSQRPNIASAAPAAKAEEQQELTPALVAALAQSVETPRPAPMPVIASAQPAPAQSAPAQPAPAQPAPAMSAAPTPVQKPVETASASPKVIHSNKGVQFGDGFDTPRSPVSASTSALPIPAKSGRPNQNAPQSANGGTLTGDALARWALNNNRASAAASMKAPRVVSRTLNNEYSAGYSGGGFRPVAATVAIDPNRFSGPNN
ncbi:DUF882 domain-containing protein [Neorhizobium galegae]|uniref:DUF882 domain-containing protein n=1 Tax=Neorhizobium galegae TaxID=399 RepID=UPI0021050B57|nr:DUF882 domain-containing protein [Neorhizobium galegae]MCQ1779728.1 DUF882 domain-containing protein [Neorhizobium galegae]MCQ1796526.1 DUF882 domain-containing protein [Neorhizobium galegae]